MGVGVKIIILYSFQDHPGLPQKVVVAGDVIQVVDVDVNPVIITFLLFPALLLVVVVVVIEIVEVRKNE